MALLLHRVEHREMYKSASVFRAVESGSTSFCIWQKMISEYD
jgi:hypothetical protein